MRHLKLLLAASLSLTALISAQAIPIPWEISNFEYASEYGQDFATATKTNYLSFTFSLSDTSGMISSLPPPVTGKVKLSSIAFGMSETTPQTNLPHLIIAQNGRVVAQSGTPQSRHQALATSSDDNANHLTWLFGFNEDVILDASANYDIIFAQAFNSATQEITPYAFPTGQGQGVLLTSNANETLMDKYTLWTPFIQFRGTYDPSLMPEPTALTVVAVGAAFALLRRRVG